jgi:hypothetical protein
MRGSKIAFLVALLELIETIPRIPWDRHRATARRHFGGFRGRLAESGAIPEWVDLIHL